ncbi:MAG: hypothetical protein R3B13_01605 [Polyangiaceae bacterium]
MSAGPRRLHAVLYALPMISVAVVAFAILGPGAERPFRVATVALGPTENIQRLPLHVAVTDRLGEAEVPVPNLTVRVQASTQAGNSAALEVQTDAQGHAFPNLKLQNGGGPVEIAVREGKRVLAEGRVSLSTADWLRLARGRGGFLDGTKRGELQVNVGPERGSVAVPFADWLVVDVRDARGPVQGAVVNLVSDDTKSARATTDGMGRARLRIEVNQHAIVVRVEARHEQREGSFWGALPVVPGAMDARLTAEGIRVASPIEREVAYVTLLGEDKRLANSALRLEPDGRGGAVGLWKIDLPASGPAWCMVSSEADHFTPGTVGWPLLRASTTRPARTLAIPDILLLDNHGARFREERRRLSKARWLAGIFVVGAAVLAIALMAIDNRRAARILTHHLIAAGSTQEEQDKLTSKSLWPWVVLTALSCVLLGFSLLALVTLARGM